MIAEISKKIYQTLKDDTTLNSYLPDVLDGTNIHELRAPEHTDSSQYPVIVYRVRTGSPLRQVKSLNALNWFIEIDILNNNADMTSAWNIFDRLYQLLQDAAIVPDSGNGITLACELDFFDTDYDHNTLIHFVLTRWQIKSLKQPDDGNNALG